MRSVTVAEGKKGFSRFIKDVAERDEEIVITKRGRPVAVIVPYGRYQHSKRIEGCRKIMEAREAFCKIGASADEIYQESRGQLEKGR